MAEFLSIQTSGTAELQRQLQRALAQLERPADLMEQLGAVLEAQIQQRFALKRDPTGAPWLPLTSSTRARYDAQDVGPDGALARRGTLLQRTGQMLESLSAIATDHSVEVGMARLTDDNRWSIPLLHETGTSRMPRRGIFLADWEAGTLGADDEAALLGEIGTWLDGVFS